MNRPESIVIYFAFTKNLVALVWLAAPNLANEYSTRIGIYLQAKLQAQIIGSRLHFDFRRYLLDKAIVVGNSGGPVIDMNGKVIGVAATGTSDRSEGNPDDQFGVIPLTHLQKLLV